MKCLLFLLICLLGAVRGNYLVTTMYTDTTTCSGDGAARVFVTHDSDCTVGVQAECTANGDWTSSDQHCYADLPGFPGVPHVEERMYYGPSCDGEPHTTAYFFTDRCLMYDRYSCIDGEITVRKFETIKCDSAAGLRQRSQSSGGCIITGTANAHIFECRS
jgi:hypothetical protein